MSARLLRIENWEAVAKKADFQPMGMADHCFISLRQLQRFFIAQFRKTPTKWIKELRFRLARALLRQGFSTKAVARELCFASESHFSHEFKKFHGVSPQNYAPTFENPEQNPENVAIKQLCRD